MPTSRRITSPHAITLLAERDLPANILGVVPMLGPTLLLCLVLNLRRNTSKMHSQVNGMLLELAVGRATCLCEVFNGMTAKFVPSVKYL